MVVSVWSLLSFVQGKKHFIGRSEGVGVVLLIQNQYRVPHVAVHGVDLEVGACRRPSLSVPHREPNGPGSSREGDHIESRAQCGQW